MSGSWDCPHEVNERCQKVGNRQCDPGMKGCVLAGRFIFSTQAKNTSSTPEQKHKSPTRQQSTKPRTKP